MKLVIRHGKSEGTRLNRALFGKQGGSLNELGKKQARELHKELLARGIDFSIAVAVSELVRTHQTAKIAGFSNLVVHPELNEINTANPQATIDNLAKGVIAPEATSAAKKLIANPPREAIWFAHGMLIAALCQELSVNTKTLVPDFCEVRRIPL